MMFRMRFKDGNNKEEKKRKKQELQMMKTNE